MTRDTTLPEQFRLASLSAFDVSALSPAGSYCLIANFLNLVPVGRCWLLVQAQPNSCRVLLAYQSRGQHPPES